MKSLSRIFTRTITDFKFKLPKRLVNLSAGNAKLPLEVLEIVQDNLVNQQGKQISVLEMGYRTKNFYDLIEAAEDSFRKVNNIPENYEIHFMNGGATLQFSAVPMNLLGPYEEKYRIANQIMNGHWSEKAQTDAILHGNINQQCVDENELQFDLPTLNSINLSPEAVQTHQTSADTRQGLEIRDFPYNIIPHKQLLVSDMSANFGSYHIPIDKYGVIYVAGHKNFTTSGCCYTIIRKDLIKDKRVEHTPTVCNWYKYSTAPGKIWTVPITFSIWVGHLMCEYMIKKGGIDQFEKKAKERSNILQNFIDKSDGFYSTFVTNKKFRSRMQVVFTIRSGESKDAKLIQKFLEISEFELGWLDIKSHPLGLPTDAIRVTMQNPQTIENIEHVRDQMDWFMKKFG